MQLNAKVRKCYTMYRKKFIYEKKRCMEVTIYKATIKGRPITKKNSQQIITLHGRPCIIPSKQYKAYAAECGWQLTKPVRPIDVKCNVQMVYFMPTKHRVDLCNLQEATLDILVRYGVLADDNSNIVCTMDGSSVSIDKDDPRVEITIDMIGEDDAK